MEVHTPGESRLDPRNLMGFLYPSCHGDLLSTMVLCFCVLMASGKSFTFFLLKGANRAFLERVRTYFIHSALKDIKSHFSHFPLASLFLPSLPLPLICPLTPHKTFWYYETPY